MDSEVRAFARAFAADPCAPLAHSLTRVLRRTSGDPVERLRSLLKQANRSADPLRPMRWETLLRRIAASLRHAKPGKSGPSVKWQCGSWKDDPFQRTQIVLVFADQNSGFVTVG